MQNDLISRSALLEHTKDLPTWYEYESRFRPSKYPYGMFDPEDIVSSIENAPAVDAVELPVRPGRVVWILNHRFPAEIEEICIREDGVFAVWVEYDRSPELTEVWDDGEFDIKEVGKTVFLTVEELEKAETEG